MPEAPITQEYRYWAFISYSSKDGAWARWLHRAIETYGIPAQLVSHETPAGEPAPKRFHPIFRDRDELPAAADLGREIENALRVSRYLIVICSPRAAQSRWVNREIEVFGELGRNDRVLAFIVDGEPHSGDAQECFPAALKRIEPIAADARRQGDGRTNAKLKLLSGMLGVSFDALKQRDAQRRIRRLQLAVAVAFVLVLAFAGLAWYATQQRDVAITQQKIATSRELASAALNQLNTDPELSMLLAVEAAKVSHTTHAEETLRQSLFRSRLRAVLRGHTDRVNSAVFSPDGKFVVTVSWDGTARVWEANTGQSVAELRGHTNNVRSAAFSPDGKFVVTASDDDTARVWEASTGRSLVELRGHTGYVISAVFSPDGKFVVTASDDGTARVWEVSTGQSVAELRGHRSGVFSAAFSPDGKFVVTVSWYGTARVWEASTGQSVAELRGHTGGVNSAAFSPDGRFVVTASWDGTAQIFACELCGSIEALLALARTRVTRELTCEERQTYLHENVTCQTAAPIPEPSPIPMPSPIPVPVPNPRPNP